MPLLLLFGFCDLYFELSAVLNYNLKFDSHSFSHTGLVGKCAPAVPIGQLEARGGNRRIHRRAWYACFHREVTTSVFSFIDELMP